MMPELVAVGPWPRGVAFGVGRRGYGGVWEKYGMY